MDFLGLINELVGKDGSPGTLELWCGGFAPELTLCATIVVMLLARLPSWGHKVNAFYLALVGSLIGLYYAAPWTKLLPGAQATDTMLGQEIFDGLLIYDPLTVYFRGILLLFLVLFLIFTRLSGIPDREDSPDFYTLVLGGTVGMCIMASANHLLTVFLGVEMASVPSYALAGILKGRRQSSEAALKYSVYGAGTAGVMLYGISLLAGALGTCHLPTIAHELLNLSPELFAQRHAVLMLGGLMVSVGLAFKLSAFPFHFWCPDVFEGASAEVNAFLSVASKAAALALLVRVAIGFTHAPAESARPDATSRAVERTSFRLASQQSTSETTTQPIRLTAAGDIDEMDEEDASPTVDVAYSVRRYMVGLISLLAAVTCTFGNLAAYNQTNIKRLLAYSTIAHAGYMMMAVAAAIQLSGDQPEQARQAIGALAFYVSVYLFMNLGAFAIVAFLRNALRSEQIADYAGLIRRSPMLVICFATILISLIGLPPLAGFAAKFFVFGYLVSARLYLLLVIGGLNTALSLFYYLRVVKVMTMEPEPHDRLPVNLSFVTPAGVYLALLTLPVVVLGIWFDALNVWARAAAQSLFS